MACKAALCDGRVLPGLIRDASRHVAIEHSITTLQFLSLQNNTGGLVLAEELRVRLLIILEAAADVQAGCLNGRDMANVLFAGWVEGR